MTVTHDKFLFSLVWCMTNRSLFFGSQESRDKGLVPFQ